MQRMRRVPQEAPCPTAALLIAILAAASCSAPFVRAGKLISKELITDNCAPPNLIKNGSEASTLDPQLKTEYSKVREVNFLGSVGPVGERRMCKLQCIGGQWVGPLCIDTQDNGRFNPLFRSCKLDHFSPHLLVTFRNVTIHTSGWILPHGAQLQTRCKELGLYKLLGAPHPKCSNGMWSSKLPSCVPTTLLTNFTDDAPPTILIRIPSGSASMEPGGDLAVFPGTTLHLECLFSRRIGSPDWTWTSTQVQYLTGWAIAPEERDWKYRLSVYYAKPQDSGMFTCATPRGITNSVSLHVTAVQCEPISISGMHLTVRIEGTRLGHTAVFQCPIGFYIKGTANITCQASGKWSDRVPTCQVVVCPSLDIIGGLSEPHLQLEEHNATFGGRAVFSCAWGYRLLGPPGLECELDGKWSGPLPKCAPIQCPPPVVPINGHLIQSESAGMDGGRYAVGSLVQFACRGSHSLEGEASIICIESGYWSHPPPFCKPRCPYLGEPDNGVMAPTKFAYEPGDELQIVCHPGYESPLEAERLTCLPDGEWSAALPHCTNYSQI